MSVRFGLLALLAERPMGVYELRKEFDARTGGTWPLNIGQVYTTVQRLVRDGLAELVPDDYDTGDAEPYRLTETGYVEAEEWWTTPVRRGTPDRDQLVIKLALAVTSPDVDVATIVHTQRLESMRALRDYTRLKAALPQDPAPQDLAWSLVLDSLVFASEAEVRWLDHAEAAVARVGTRGAASSDRETPDGVAPVAPAAPTPDASREPIGTPRRRAPRAARPR